MTHATKLLTACAAVMLVASASAMADDIEGTAEQARAMLLRAVAAIQADESRALAAFNAGEAGFKDHDLYVFCAGRDGVVDAHIDPAQRGRNMRDIYDLLGVAFGREMMAVAREGEIVAVSYMWPRPVSKVPVHKVTFVTRTADQMCGVGYYVP